MTKTQKIQALVTLAVGIAPELPTGDDLHRRAVYLACSLYRNRYGNRPTQTLIDDAIAVAREVIK